MSKRMTESQRSEVLDLLSKGLDRDTIAAHVGVTPGQVSALRAHVTMGTYDLEAQTDEESDASTETREHIEEFLNKHSPTDQAARILNPIPIGNDVESSKEVYWNPDPDSGTANPHV